MKTIKIMVALMVLVASNMFSQAAEMNIHQNNWRVGGTLGAAYSSSGGGVFGITPRVQYFIFDRFAAGLDGTGSFSSDTTSFTLGPVITYYFGTAGNWAFSAEEEILFSSATYSSGPATTITSSNTKLGADYFVTPSVSFGPSLTYGRVLSSSYSSSSYSSVLLLGSFSIFF